MKYGTEDCFTPKNMLSISVLTEKSQLRKWATDFGSGSRHIGAKGASGSRGFKRENAYAKTKYLMRKM